MVKGTVPPFLNPATSLYTYPLFHPPIYITHLHQCPPSSTPSIPGTSFILPTPHAYPPSHPYHPPTIHFGHSQLFFINFILCPYKNENIIGRGGQISPLKNPPLVWPHQLSLKAIPQVKIFRTQR